MTEGGRMKMKAKFYCGRCGADVIGGRCRCLSGPSPWIEKPRYRSSSIIAAIFMLGAVVAAIYAASLYNG
jgi:hypothetical protein